MASLKKVAAVVGGLAVVSAAVALTAGTYAYFSDSHTVPAETVQTGSLRLDIVVDHGGSTGAINFSNAEPGSSQTETVTFTNSGTVSGYLRVAVRPTVTNVLEDTLQVQLPGSRPIPLAQAANYASSGFGMPLLAPGRSVTFPVTVSIPSSVGNEAQGLTAAFDIVADLLQAGDNAPTTAPFPAPPS
jgi:predicted ribosomally synthesized peptide with SipW-like signal peptide